MIHDVMMAFIAPSPLLNLFIIGSTERSIGRGYIKIFINIITSPSTPNRQQPYHLNLESGYYTRHCLRLLLSPRIFSDINRSSP